MGITPDELAEARLRREQLGAIVCDEVDRELVRQYLAARLNEAKHRMATARTIRQRREAIGAFDELLTIYLPLVGEQA